MLYVIHKGGVDGYTEGQNPIVHLVTHIEQVVARRIPFVFTDGHADIEVSGQYTNLDDLQRVDWKLMESQYWNDTNEHPDRKRRRQAEFLVHQLCPWDLVNEIGVFDLATEQRVAAVLVLSQPNCWQDRDGEA